MFKDKKPKEKKVENLKATSTLINSIGIGIAKPENAAATDAVDLALVDSTAGKEGYRPITLVPGEGIEYSFDSESDSLEISSYAEDRFELKNISVDGSTNVVKPLKSSSYLVDLWSGGLNSCTLEINLEDTGDNGALDGLVFKVTKLAQGEVTVRFKFANDSMLICAHDLSGHSIILGEGCPSVQFVVMHKSPEPDGRLAIVLSTYGSIQLI